MTGDDLNVVHSKHKSDYKNILTELVYEKDDFESRFKELLDHAAITWQGINIALYFLTTK